MITRLVIILALLAGVANAQHYQFARSASGEIDLRDRLPVGIASSCVFWATFDYNSGTVTYDYSSSSNHGNIVNGGVIVKPSGTSKGYIVLDGSDDYVVFSNTASMRQAGDCTFAFWVYNTNATVGTFFLSYHENTGISGKGWWLDAGSSTAYAPRLLQYYGYPSLNTVNGTTALNTPVNPWHSVVFTHFGTTNTIYVDGTAAGSSAAGAVATTFNVTNFVQIGSYVYYPGPVRGNYWKGRISRAQFFNRAFSAAEVADTFWYGQNVDYYPTVKWRSQAEYFAWNPVVVGRSVYVSSSDGGAVAHGPPYVSHLEKFDVDSGVLQGSLNLGTNTSAGPSWTDGAAIYTPCSGSNWIAETAVASFTVTTNITGVIAPFSGCIESTNMWVASSSGLVYRVNRITRGITATVDVGGTNALCKKIVYDGWSNVWVACFNSNYVSQINVDTATEVRRVATGLQPWGITYDAALSNVWVANYGTDTVQSISITSGVVTATYGTGSGASKGQHDIVHLGTRIFTVASNTDELLEYSTSLGPGTKVGYTKTTGNDPDGLWWDAATESLFVTAAQESSVEKWRIPRQ